MRSVAIVYLLLGAAVGVANATTSVLTFCSPIAITSVPAGRDDPLLQKNYSKSFSAIGEVLLNDGNVFEESNCFVNNNLRFKVFDIVGNGPTAPSSVSVKLTRSAVAAGRRVVFATNAVGNTATSLHVVVSGTNFISDSTLAIVGSLNAGSSVTITGNLFTWDESSTVAQPTSMVAVPEFAQYGYDHIFGVISVVAPSVLTESSALFSRARVGSVISVTANDVRLSHKTPYAASFASSAVFIAGAMDANTTISVTSNTLELAARTASPPTDAVRGVFVEDTQNYMGTTVSVVGNIIFGQFPIAVVAVGESLPAASIIRVNSAPNVNHTYNGVSLRRRSLSVLRNVLVNTVAPTVLPAAPVASIEVLNVANAHTDALIAANNVFGSGVLSVNDTTPTYRSKAFVSLTTRAPPINGTFHTTAIVTVRDNAVHSTGLPLSNATTEATSDAATIIVETHSGRNSKLYVGNNDAESPIRVRVNAPASDRSNSVSIWHNAVTFSAEGPAGNYIFCDAASGAAGLDLGDRCDPTVRHYKMTSSESCHNTCVFGIFFGIMWGVVIIVFIIEYGMWKYFGDPNAVRRGEVVRKSKAKKSDEETEIIMGEIHMDGGDPKAEGVVTVEAVDENGHRRIATDRTTNEQIANANQ